MKEFRVVHVIAASVLSILSVSAAQAQSWAEQQAYNRERTRQALQQQAQQGYSPQVQQGARWENEWRQQHPGQPMPSFGALEKLHRNETMQNMNVGFDRMRQNRQRELQRNYQWARQNQERDLAAQHITWSPQQWKNWDRRYDQEQQQRAIDAANAQTQSANFARDAEEARRYREAIGAH